MPPVVLSQEIGLSPEGQRERKNYFTAALCLGIPGVIMLLSPFICIALLISESLPMIGSILPSLASSTKSFAYTG
ncbi:MAG: hypothetical protein KH147_03380, partial [Actinomyces graevenitzii]|nr:hypothetical protein [Actinomyces graevenitzii]